MKRFSDFADKSSAITGDKIKIKDVLEKEIIIIGYRVNDSKQKVGTKVLTLQFKLNGEERILFTGSTVLIEQIEKYSDEIPFTTKIEQIDKFYTFT